MQPYVQLLPRLCAKREFQGVDGQALCQPAFRDFARFKGLLACAPRCALLPRARAQQRARARVRAWLLAWLLARGARTRRCARREACASGAHRVRC